MPNEIVHDEVNRANVVAEYGQAMAFAAECFLRYPDRMSNARTDDQRVAISEDYARILRHLTDSYPVALAALERRKVTMWSRIMKAVRFIVRIVGIVEKIDDNKK